MAIKPPNPCPKRSNRGAIYRSLYRVGGEALTLKAICTRFGVTEGVARWRIQNARKHSTPLTQETFK
jgi:hypothetical protein